MTDLSSSSCEACRIDAPLLDDTELAAMLPQIPAWEVIEVDGVKQLRRSYSFANFRSALAFVNSVGDAAEQEDHHPAILLEWGKVTVSWWSHKARGIHRNDVIMAAKTDSLYL